MGKGIAANIKRLRSQYGLTQSELAKIAGVSSDKAVSNWETGLAEPKMGAIERMSNHFGIPKSDIIDEQGTPFMDAETMAYAMSLRDRPEMQILFRVAQGVSKADLEMAVSMIERMKR